MDQNSDTVSALPQIAAPQDFELNEFEGDIARSITSINLARHEWGDRLKLELSPDGFLTAKLFFQGPDDGFYPLEVSGP